jgi:hypothetical protein
MKKLCLLVVVSVSFNSLCSQEVKQEVKRVPTVEECRAEQTLWMSRLDEPNDAGTVDVNYGDLNDWGFRMLLCGSIDPDLRWQYYNTQRELSEVQTKRLIRFLVRHNLYGQFLAEDAQGRR